MIDRALLRFMCNFGRTAHRAGAWILLHCCSVRDKTGSGKPIRGIKYWRYDIRASSLVRDGPTICVAKSVASANKMHSAVAEDPDGEMNTPKVL
jgi:hypothetical protein